jgi:hypothetical protein
MTSDIFGFLLLFSVASFRTHLLRRCDGHSYPLIQNAPVGSYERESALNFEVSFGHATQSHSLRITGGDIAHFYAH